MNPVASWRSAAQQIVDALTVGGHTKGNALQCVLNRVRGKASALSDGERGEMMQIHHSNEANEPSSNHPELRYISVHEYVEACYRQNVFG